MENNSTITNCLCCGKFTVRDGEFNLCGSCEEIDHCRSKKMEKDLTKYPPPYEEWESEDRKDRLTLRNFKNGL